MFVGAAQEKARAPRLSRDALGVLFARPPKRRVQYERDLVHSAHAAAWATMSTCCGGLLVIFPDVGHQSFGGEHQGGNRSGVLEREACDLGRVDNARLD